MRSKEDAGVRAVKEEIKAGILILSSFVLLTVSVVLIGGSRFFEKPDLYYVRVMNTAGLDAGSQVRLGGVRVGKVLAVQAPAGPGKPVSLTVGLKKGTVLYQGTKAMITQIGFVGDIYLLLAVDNTTDKRLAPGSDIPAQEIPDFAKLMLKMDELSGSVQGLIKDVNKVFSETNLKNIEKILGHADSAIVSGTSNIEKLSAALQTVSGRLGRLLAEVESLVSDNKGEISAVIKKAREDMEHAGEMMKSISAAAKKVESATGSAERAIGIQSRNLEALIVSLTRTTEDLRDLLHDIKQKPWSILYREGQNE